MTVPQYGSGKGFIVDLRENSQRHLEESRAEWKLNMADRQTWQAGRT